MSVLKKMLADFRTSLSIKIAAGGTSGTIQNNLDDDGVTLPTGSYCFTLDADNTQKEHITATLTGKNLTDIISISRQGAETTGVVREHRVGATVTITDFSHILNHNKLLNGDTAFDNKLKYATDLTFTDDKELVAKKYIDDIAIAGSPKATEAVYGIAKLSVAAVSAVAPIVVGNNDGRMPTQDENNALVGTSGTPSSTNKYVTDNDTSATAAASKVVRSGAGSKIAESYLQMTDAQATDLTDGGSTTLHQHQITFGAFSKDATSTTTTTIAHGLGRTPGLVRLKSAMSATAAECVWTDGAYNGVSNYCSYRTYNSNGNTTGGGTTGSYAIVLGWTSNSAGDMLAGAVTVDATNITITWSKVGSPTQTWGIYYEVN